VHHDDCRWELHPGAGGGPPLDSTPHAGEGTPRAGGTVAAFAVEVEGGMVDAEAPLARDGLDQRRDRLLPQVFAGPAGGTDQVVMMAGLAPDLSRAVTR